MRSLILAIGLVAGLPCIGGPVFAQSPPPVEGVENALRARAAAAPPEGYTSIATGVFLADQWHVLTNAHAVMACSVIKLENSELEDVPATVIALDTRVDIALLRSTDANSHGLGIATLDRAPGEAAKILTFDGLPGAASRGMQVPATVTADPLSRRGLATLSVEIGSGQSGSPVIRNGDLIDGMVIGRLVRTGRGAIATGQMISDLLEYVGLKIPSDLDADDEFERPAEAALVAVRCTR
ncbi:MAG: serine protease [Pseudomonadota bacterium]